MLLTPFSFESGAKKITPEKGEPPTVTGSTIDRLSHHSTKSNGNQTNHSNGIIRLYGKIPLW